MLKILCTYVVLIPLLVWHSHFEVPKVFALILGGLILLIHLVINYKEIKINKRDKWYLYWLLWLVICGALGEDFKVSILGGSYRHQGVIFFFCLWLFLRALELLKLKEKILLNKIVGLNIIVQAILVIIGYKLGTLGDINAVSGYLAIGLFFVASFLPKWIVGIPLLAIILNFSKSGFLALLPYIYAKKYLIPIMTIIVLIFVFKPINLNSPFENRQVIWGHSINLISKSPLFGYGLESNEKIFDRSFYQSGFPLSNLIIDRAHNLFFDVTLWSGLVGLFLFVKFLYYSFLNLDLDRKKAFLGFLIFSMFQPLSVAHWLLFILII